MDNAYYILAKKKINIERLHICTWEFPNASSYIEFGIEFPYDNFKEEEAIRIWLSVPFIEKEDDVACLLENLSESANSRFIFNAIVTSVENVGVDDRDGRILKFEGRNPLTVLPFSKDVSDGKIVFTISKPPKYDGNLYIRAKVKHNGPIAIIKKGITKKSYIYDLKINETRNIPQDIYNIKSKNKLVVCSIKNLFCLHSVPDDFEFSFIDHSKLKNIRKLEAEAFKKYLPDVKDIGKDCYNIMFLKDIGKESYSLFTICTKEMIGPKQIVLAIGANILCSLLFGFSSLRFDSNIEWYRQIPWEYWGALVILILLLIYSFRIFKTIFKK